jgi:hypothetical protein
LNYGRFLVKINRICAWLLLIFMVVFLVSGYAWANRSIMPVQLAVWMHTRLDLFLVILLLLHVLTSTKFALKRWRVGHERIVNILLIIVGVAALWTVLLIR